MIGQVREWLPYNALTHDIVGETIERAVVQWSERWFVGAHACVKGLKPVSGAPRHEDDAGWRVYGQVVALQAGRNALADMVDAAMDIDTETMILTEGDKYLRAALEQQILTSLAWELEQAFDLPRSRPESASSRPESIWDPLADGGGVIVSLAARSGRDILTAAVPVDLVLPKIKAYLGPAARRPEPLRPLGAALGSANITIEALVGKATLTLTELSDLVVGDVLVLDRTMDQPVDIAAAGSHQIFAKAMLTNVDDGIALVFNA